MTQLNKAQKKSEFLLQCLVNKKSKMINLRRSQALVDDSH